MRIAVGATAPARAARAEGHRFLVLCSRFNGAVVEKLCDGAVHALADRGAAAADVRVVWVPGALELPLAAARAAALPGIDAIICLGCVIQGGTDHYEHVCRATVDGILRASLDHDRVITNGVLTVATEAQAWERAGGAHGNKGADAALAAVELIDALHALARNSDLDDQTDSVTLSRGGDNAGGDGEDAPFDHSPGQPDKRRR
jgi:6,7-dimethyl-8-ribityllumazine synthase